ncbi:unnamed protein product [Moneuplotes crassus]|uniref:Uncharacterized protein n=1 Tax=Euplotes crassus TaxID=5936 RepID=A0AAD1XX29_EUPCR|nr:unnamed protein product [Moneuplotes crassus]
MESTSSRNSLSPTKDNLNRRGNPNPRMNSPVAKAEMQTQSLRRQVTKKHSGSRGRRVHHKLVTGGQDSLRKVFSEERSINTANMKYPASKRLGLFNTGDLLQGNKESEKISDVLRRNGGNSIIIPDLCHEISFDTPDPHPKNPWKMFGELIFKKNLNMSYLVNIRNCKKKILESLKKLNTLKGTILKNFEVYQNYIFKMFIKGKKYQEDKHMLAFLALSNDKLYFKFLRQAIIKKDDFESLMGDNLQTIEKHSMFFNQERYIMHERSLINCMKKMENDESFREKLINVQTRALFLPDLSSFHSECSKNNLENSSNISNSELLEAEEGSQEMINVKSPQKLKQLKKILPKEMHKRLSVVAGSIGNKYHQKKSMSVLVDMHNAKRKHSKFGPVNKRGALVKLKTSVAVHSPEESGETMVRISEDDCIEEDEFSDTSGSQSKINKKDLADDKQQNIDKKIVMRKILKHKAKLNNILVKRIHNLKAKMPCLSPLKRVKMRDASTTIPSRMPSHSKSVNRTTNKARNRVLFAPQKDKFSLTRIQNTSVQSPVVTRKAKSPMISLPQAFSHSIITQSPINPGVNTPAGNKKIRRKYAKIDMLKAKCSKFASYKVKFRLADL